MIKLAIVLFDLKFTDKFKNKLNRIERRSLMIDTYNRAKEAGIRVKYNKKARLLIYGYNQ